MHNSFQHKRPNNDSLIYDYKYHSKKAKEENMSALPWSCLLTPLPKSKENVHACLQLYHSVAVTLLFHGCNSGKFAVH